MDIMNVILIENILYLMLQSILKMQDIKSTFMVEVKCHRIYFKIVHTVNAQVIIVTTECTG